jgi:hypothetical protein
VLLVTHSCGHTFCFLHQVRLNSDSLGENLDGQVTHPELPFVEMAQRNLSQVVLVCWGMSPPLPPVVSQIEKGWVSHTLLKLSSRATRIFCFPAFIYISRKGAYHIPRTIDLLITVMSTKPERLRDFIRRSFTTISLTQMAITLP